MTSDKTNQTTRYRPAEEIAKDLMDAVTRTKADPNRSFREDALVVEIEHLRSMNADLRMVLEQKDARIIMLEKRILGLYLQSRGLQVSASGVS